MKRFVLRDHHSSPHLWTRELAKNIRKSLLEILDGTKTGETIVIDLKGVEVFDYSFANEFFGKTLLSLQGEYPGRCILVQNLNEYTRENLSKALEGLSLAMAEKKGEQLELIGKIHSAYRDTFAAIAKAGHPVTASELRDQLNLNITAMNERLTKLTELALVYRGEGTSKAGRQQYEYSAPG